MAGWHTRVQRIGTVLVPIILLALSLEAGRRWW
jgi:hypothetical protein